MSLQATELEPPVLAAHQRCRAADATESPMAVLRRLGPNVAAGIADQALSSGASAAVNFALAAWMTAGDYGVFSLGSTIFLIASGFHNSLILEPVSVLGASRFVKDLRLYLRHVLFGQLLLALAASVLLAAGAFLAPVEADVKTALLGAAILTPPLLTVWYLRRVQYLTGTPQKAARIAVLYAAALVILLGAARQVGHLSAFVGLGLMAAAAALACIPNFRLPSVRGLAPSFQTVAGAHWGFGKWFMAAPFLAVGTNHIQVLMVASCLGMAGTGALRATMNFALPLVQLITALSNLALPSLARTYNEEPAKFRSAAMKLMLTYGAGGFAYMAILSLFGHRLQTLIYGGKFNAGAGTFPILGVWIFSVCVSNASGVVLRAQRTPNACLLGLIAGSVFGFVTAKPLILAYGVPGAAISMAGTYVASSIVQIVAFRRTSDSSKAPALQEVSA